MSRVELKHVRRTIIAVGKPELKKFAGIVVPQFQCAGPNVAVTAKEYHNGLQYVIGNHWKRHSAGQSDSFRSVNALEV
jgi:hypothetical protein